MAHTEHRTVALRVTAWRDACRRKGLHTYDSRARALGMSKLQLLRVEKGTSAPGLTFMAEALTLLRDLGLTWEQLFKVRGDRD